MQIVHVVHARYRTQVGFDGRQVHARGHVLGQDGEYLPPESEGADQDERPDAQSHKGVPQRIVF